MTGSGLNVDTGSIFPGMPLSVDKNGNVLRADSSNPPIAVALDGGRPRMVVSYASDGVIIWPDWTNVAGQRQLIPNQAYYLSGKGQLSTSGTFRVGIAQTETSLMVSFGGSSGSGTVGATGATGPSGVTGSIGSTGPTGPAGSAALSFVAGVTIPSPSVVMINAGLAYPFEPAVEANYFKVVGVSSNAVLSGGTVNVIPVGSLSSPGSFVADSVYYAGAAGALTTTVPSATGISVKIGYALTTDVLVVDIYQPMVLL
jgi:hypothetical protein